MNIPQGHRGQITIFIIAGIAMVLILGLVVYLIGNASHATPKLEVQPSDAAVQACIEQATAVALEELGQSGGYADGTFLGTNRISYGIRAASSSNLFGQVTLDPLCLRNGPNRPNADGDGNNSCMGGTYQVFQPDNQVIQYQLAQSIQNHLSGCGYNRTVNVLFGIDDITVQTESETVRLPYRIKRIYDAAFRIAQQDTQDAFYDKRSVSSLLLCPEQRNNGDCFFSGMSATSSIVSGVHVVSIIDAGRQIQGAPFVFEYAVEDRPPVFFLGETGSEQYQTQTVTVDPSTEPIVLRVVDPDEDTLAVTCDSNLCDIKTTGIVTTIKINTAVCAETTVKITATEQGITPALSVTQEITLKPSDAQIASEACTPTNN